MWSSHRHIIYNYDYMPMSPTHRNKFVLWKWKLKQAQPIGDILIAHIGEQSIHKLSDHSWPNLWPALHNWKWQYTCRSSHHLNHRGSIQLKISMRANSVYYYPHFFHVMTFRWYVDTTRVYKLAKLYSVTERNLLYILRESRERRLMVPLSTSAFTHPR